MTKTVTAPQVLLIAYPKLYRDALREILQRELGVQVVSECTHLSEVLSELERTEVELVVFSSVDLDPSVVHYFDDWMERFPRTRIVSVGPESLCVSGPSAPYCIDVQELSTLLATFRHLFVAPKNIQENRNVASTSTTVGITGSPIPGRPTRNWLRDR